MDEDQEKMSREEIMCVDVANHIFHILLSTLTSKQNMMDFGLKGPSELDHPF
jgi:hypothetical protein